MAAQKIWCVFDAAGVVVAAYSDEGEARRLAGYFGSDDSEIASAGVEEVWLDRPVEAFAVDDEHR